MSSELDKILSQPVSINMRRDPPQVLWIHPVSYIVEKMLEEDIGAVIVVGKEDRPIGIITERDLLENVVKKDRDIDETLVKEVMSDPLISIESSEPTSVALDLMHEKKIRRLAVIEKGNLVGIVTERRLLEGVFQGIR